MTPERWQRIEQLYHEALERGETQRAAFLQEICAGDDELRQEVASLLAQDNRSQQFLERSELEAAARVVAEKESQTPLIGKRLGSYQVLSQVGAGGMGEVYKARDTRLDRFVAIKVLPPHLADRTELRERFEREARTIASLNHPHICTLHDIGHQVGTDFLVMEYLEGETLAQRLQKGSLPIQQVLQYAIEIADALDKAHRKGVTHRDLKPGNIMLTKLGAKLLDFGLAKLKEELAPANVPLSELPTVDDPLTAKGAIIGTLQYMAPEQLEAKEVDARTDIFAFGAVVYEMATGKKAFEGKSQASLIAKILETDPPPISSLQPMTPPALDRVVRKCLAKEPDQRWQTASDLCGELKWIAEGSSQVGAIAASTVNVQDALRKRFAWASVGLAACAIIALTVWNLKPTPPKPVVRTVITLPPGDRLGAGAPQLPALAISRDGKQLVYAAIHGVTSQLYLRPLDIQEARPIPNTEGASEPFFSPDGQWIGFYAGGKLKKISVSGGAAVILADALNQFGASWGSQSKIVFAPSVGSPLLQVSDAGGDPRPLTQPEKGISDIWPDFLPGGKAVLFTAESLASSRIAALSLATGKQHNLVSGTQPRYSISGHLIYTRSGGTLMAVPFDPQRLEITGTPVPVVEGVAQSADGETTQYSISDSGTLVYFSGGSQSNQRKIVWVSRDGADQLLPVAPHAYEYVRLSPDGRRVAVQLDGQIWLYDFARDTLTRFTFEGGGGQSPVWTPDGTRIAFYSIKEGTPNIFWQRADGNGGLERLSAGQHAQIPRSFSPNGQFLAFHENNPKTQRDIWVLRLDDHKAQPFLITSFMEGGPTFSPDGHWLAYVSDESGRPEVYVQPFPGPGGKWQISTEGGTEPAWNPNGKELFYRSGNKMMALDVTRQPSFSVGKPHMLFEGNYFTIDWPLAGTAYDVSADGQRFLMVKATEQSSVATQINIVLNWFEDLKQKVPTAKN